MIIYNHKHYVTYRLSRVFLQKRLIQNLMSFVLCAPRLIKKIQVFMVYYYLTSFYDLLLLNY